MRNYKRNIKYFVAKILYWIPDSVMLRIQYHLLLKRKLNIRTPQRFSEKLQWYKAYYRNPEMLECVDKYRVREYVTKKLGTDRYLNELYQVCDDASQIDFKVLPEKFVIKTTDGGSGDNILICKSKQELDIPHAVRSVNSWRNKEYFKISREWAYKGAIQSKVIVEKFLESKENKDGSIDDYKFLCYNGIFRYLWVDKGRYSKHTRCFYDQNLTWIRGIESDYPASDNEFSLPANIHDMVSVAERLSSGFPFVRVDLYNVDGRILFGEMTFYPVSGYVRFIPDDFDYELGRYFNTSTSTSR